METTDQVWVITSPSRRKEKHRRIRGPFLGGVEILGRGVRIQIWCGSVFAKNRHFLPNQARTFFYPKNRGPFLPKKPRTFFTQKTDKEIFLPKKQRTFFYPKNRRGHFFTQKTEDLFYPKNTCQNITTKCQNIGTHQLKIFLSLKKYLGKILHTANKYGAKIA